MKSGAENLINMEGHALESFKKSGWVFINGERWRATANRPIKKQQKIIVKHVEGLMLTVMPALDENEKNSRGDEK